MHIGQEHISEQDIVEEMDQFQLLEDKIDRLIKHVNTLKQEKEALENKLSERESTINELRLQVERLQTDKDKARERIAAVLNKIDQIDTESFGEIETESFGE